METTYSIQMENNGSRSIITATKTPYITHTQEAVHASESRNKKINQGGHNRMKKLENNMIHHRYTHTSSKRRSTMFRNILIATVLFAMVLLSGTVMAAGTAPGTVISNQATASYTVGGASLNSQSSAITTTVAERLEVTVTWQDASNVSVQPAENNKPLKFRVTNTGNGSESFNLTASSVLAGDDFNPTFQNIYLDSGNGTWDGTGVETLYSAGTNDPTIATGAYITVYVVNNIGGTVTDGQLGFSQLKAKAKTITGSMTPGTLYAGAGDGGTAAVVGLANGSGNTDGGTGLAVGTYQVSSVVVAVVKTATAVLDPWGGTNPVPGATITYRIEVDVTGTGTATAVKITDPIPGNTAYKTGTLKLDTGAGLSALTDAADADAGDVGGTTVGTVTVNLGNLTEASSTMSIEFTVTIQ
jgi:uncharacterized repeat protein (TIGR01451 family)